MNASLVRSNPLAAFALAVIVVAFYFIAFLTLASSRGEQSASPSVAWHLGFIWLPVILSGVLYSWATKSIPLSLSKRLIQALVSAILAPTIAGGIILFIGFIFLGWQM